jgi:branched-chain amino acid transport system permease protein
VAAVLGGIGSMPGAVLGSLVLGWTESFFTGYISSDYEDVFAFIFLVLILIFRPAGIWAVPDTDKGLRYSIRIHGRRHKFRRSPCGLR